MTHPHKDWTKARLDSYNGTTETLTLEFKASDSLRAVNKKDKASRVIEAAIDVAAMANEQGGVIIYGMMERKRGPWSQAVGLDTGFELSDGVSREWFLQVMRDHVHPPLPDLDAVDVALGQDHFALVVLVPQAKGTARQSDDLWFWRRDAQGLRRMSIQEIEDVRLRAVRPSLDLSLGVVRPQNLPEGIVTIATRWDVVNSSAATATFAVITIGLHSGASIHVSAKSDWINIETAREWAVVRCILSAGSSKNWSPITPGFTLITDLFDMHVKITESDVLSDRPIGLARMDSDGGTRLYSVDFWLNSFDQANLLRLRAVSDDDLSSIPFCFWSIPAMFAPQSV